MSDEKDFTVCREALQFNQRQDSEIPHLNKTTSIVVNEAFKNKNNTKAHPKHHGSINYRIVGQSHHQHNLSKRSSGENSNRQSRDTNVIASVKDSIDSITTAKKRINLSHMVPPPQILSQPKKQPLNGSAANLVSGLNRSVAE